MLQPKTDAFNNKFDFLTPDGEWAIFPHSETPFQYTLVHNLTTLIPFKESFCGFDPKSKTIFNFAVSGNKYLPEIIKSDLSKFKLNIPSFGFSRKWCQKITVPPTYDSYEPIRPDMVRFFLENIENSKIVKNLNKPDADLLQNVTSFKNEVFQFPLVGTPHPLLN